MTVAPPPAVSLPESLPLPESDPELLSRTLADWIDVDTAISAEAEPPLTTRQIGLGLAGYLALPLVGLLDIAGPGLLPTAVAPPIAALLLSVPSLVVGHQYLGLAASPRDLMADVGRVFVQAGRLSLGLVPAVGLYAATTGLGPAALALALTGIGLASVELARRRLIRRERRASPADQPPTPAQRLRMVGLATAWSALALLIAVRLGFTLLHAL